MGLAHKGGLLRLDQAEAFELPPTAFHVNLADALSAALRESKGVGALPMSSAVPALRSGSLVRVLPGYHLQKLTAYVLYPSRQYLDAKVWTFVEFLREVVPQALVADPAAMNYQAVLVNSASTAASRRESSAVTSGEKRPTTWPLRPIRNFSKFHSTSA
jgi:hypothetical protein